MKALFFNGCLFFRNPGVPAVFLPDRQAVPNALKSLRLLKEDSMRTELRIFAMLMLGLMAAGCSKTDQLTDQAATNFVERIQSPIDQARAITERAAASRGAEMPQ